MAVVIESAGIIGAGIMGAGIAQVLASNAEVQVTLLDIKEELVQAGLANIKKSLQRLVAKKRMDAGTMAAALGRIRGATSYDALGSCDLIIEVVSENPAIKAKVMASIDAVAKPSCIIASNTSSISITKLAAMAKGRAKHFCGMHFFNPVPVMKLVEVIRGLETSDETTKAVVELATRMGKTPVECNDSFGFVANRALVPFINEACQMLLEGVADAPGIDKICKLGLNHPLGPLALADMIGLDTCLAVMEVLHANLGDKYLPCTLLRKMVDAGHLGRKSGQGFYTYAKM